MPVTSLLDESAELPSRMPAGPMIQPDVPAWGAMLKEYEAGRKAQPPLEAYEQGRARVTHASKHAEQARYNPLLQTFTDGSEASVREQEVTMVTRHLNRARDRQTSLESEFDLLTLRSKHPGLSSTSSTATSTAGSDALQPTSAARRELPYNILSGVSVAHHSYLPPAARPTDAELVGEPKPKLQTATSRPREHDLLSGRYVRGHEERTAADKARERRRAAHSFWETHDYDPLKCEFYNPHKEARLREREAAALAEQPHKSYRRLPPSLQKSEGVAYDITSHAVKDAALCEAREASAQQAADKGSKTRKLEVAMREKGVEQLARDERRALRRASYRRYDDAFGRGYSIVDGRDYGGGGARPPPAQQPAPLFLWQSLRACGGGGGEGGARPATVRCGGFS